MVGGEWVVGVGGGRMMGVSGGRVEGDLLWSVAKPINKKFVEQKYSTEN